MTSLPAIMDALADTLRDAFKDTVEDVQVDSRMNIAPKTFPVIDIYPAAIPRPAGTAGFSEIEGAVVLTIRARINTGDHAASQDVLLSFLDDEDDLCVAAAVAADPTLSDKVTQASAVTATGFGVYRDVGGEGAYLGCEWLATIFK
jgi:hypothetical protein